jgi:hypothetical protein
MAEHFTLEEITASWLGHGKQIPISQMMAWLIREVERLKRGKFTAEEFQNLCHEKEWPITPEVFAYECRVYQRELFGYSPTDNHLRELSVALVKARESQHHEDCDTRDTMIQGKPCNCYLHFKAALAAKDAALMEAQAMIAKLEFYHDHDSCGTEPEGCPECPDQLDERHYFKTADEWAKWLAARKDTGSGVR